MRLIASVLCCAPRQRVSSRSRTPPVVAARVAAAAAVQHVRRRPIPDLKVVALGGEALPPKLVEACSDDFSLVSV